MTWKKAAKDYSQKVLATQSAALAGYWPLNEATSATVGRNLKVTANPTGTFGSGWSFGAPGVNPNETCLSNTGSGAPVNATIASYDGGTCSIMAWVKPTPAAYSDSTARYAFGARVDANNHQYITKSNTANILRAIDVSTGTQVVSTKTDVNFAQMGWLCLVASYTPTTVLMYINGVAVGSATARSATFTGAATTVQFSFSGQVWVGSLAHCAMWAGVNLTAAEIANLYKFGY